MPHYKPIRTSDYEENSQDEEDLYRSTGLGDETENNDDDSNRPNDRSESNYVSADNETDATENDVDDTASESDGGQTRSVENGSHQNNGHSSVKIGSHTNNGNNFVENDSHTNNGHSSVENGSHQINGKGSAENDSHQNKERDSHGDPNVGFKDKGRRKRAESARDLVQSQEQLILMLQSMKNDLGKIDREATSIKEEVVRSRQLFDVVVGRRRLHHLDYSTNGYNFTYAMPRVSYHRNSPDEPRKKMSQLSQLSTYCNYSPNTSRRSSLSSTSSRRSSYQGDIEYFRSRFRTNADQNTLPQSQCVTSQSEYSETESEYDSELPSKWSRDATENPISVSGMSSDGCMTDSSVVTDSSAERIAKRLSDYERKRKERRSSYFFTRKPESTQNDLSDDVCV